MDSQLVRVEATDEFPKNINVSDSQIDAIKLRKISETGNLASQLNLKVGSQVMITSNIDINDRLVNSLVGRVTQFKYSNNVVLFMLNLMMNWVPIKKREVMFGLRKNRQQPSVKKHNFLQHCHGLAQFIKYRV